MRILLTGGTGLIGRALCRHWLAEGHTLWVLSRHPERVAHVCGNLVRGICHLEALDDEPLDAVVNLAGAPIADRPWTARRRRLLWDSRVTLTEQLVRWLASREQLPELLISGSAVGYYGDTGEPLVDEQTPAGEDFAAKLCLGWEMAAQAAETVGMRVVTVRTGLVLAREGGFLQRLLPVFRLGLGGRLGNGQQWMPWIHLDDQVALIDALLHQPHASGAFNACAPEPVRNAAFTEALGRRLHRPTLLPLPAPLLRVGLGELSGLLLGGQHALPARLQLAGFAFRHSYLATALDDLLGQARR